MYVIMDMEWCKREDVAFITQLAALRIDANYEVIDTFKRYVFPATLESINWKNKAFAGATPSEFLCGDHLDKCFSDLDSWLQPTDVLLWWDETSRMFFRSAHLRLAKYELTNAMPIIRVGVKTVLKDGKLNHGTPFQLCEARKLPARAPAHNALIATYNIRRLLRWINEPLVNIVHYSYDSLENSVFLPDLITGSITPIDQVNKSSSAYMLDATTGIVHRPGCEKIIAADNSLRSLPKKVCIETDLKMCSCCKGGKGSNQEKKSDDSDLVSIYASKTSSRHIAHYKHCRVLSRVPTERVITFANIDDAKAAGYHMCKYCISVERFYKTVRERAQVYCRENGLTCVFKDGVLHISSEQDFWRIIVDEATAKPVLYHRNRFRNRKSKAPIEDYHKQYSKSHKILVLLKQIASHDKYAVEKEQKKEQALKEEEQNRRRNPGYNPPSRNSKKGQKLAKKQKKKIKKQKIARTLAVIEELEALRSK